MVLYFMYHKATMIFHVIFYCTLQLLLLNFNEGIAVGRGPVFNGPGRSLVSATLSDRQTYITANTCYMKYYVSCKRQRVMHDDKYHHCNAVQIPCIIYCYLGWKMETPQIDHILLLHINLDGIHEQGEKWKPPKLTDLMSEKPFTFCNLYGIHKAPNT